MFYLGIILPRFPDSRRPQGVFLRPVWLRPLSLKPGWWNVAREARRYIYLGTQDHGTKGPWDQGAMGPCDHGTKGLMLWDQGTMGPQDHGTKGPWGPWALRAHGPWALRAQGWALRARWALRAHLSPCRYAEDGLSSSSMRSKVCLISIDP